MGKPTVKIHPNDCKKLKLNEGCPVLLGNERGEVELEVEVFEGLQQGVVVVESIWPNSAFKNGKGINTLTSADFGQPNGGAVFHDTAVWLVPVK